MGFINFQVTLDIPTCLVSTRQIASYKQTDQIQTSHNYGNNQSAKQRYTNYFNCPLYAQFTFSTLQLVLHSLSTHSFTVGNLLKSFPKGRTHAIKSQGRRYASPAGSYIDTTLLDNSSLISGFIVYTQRHL